VGVGGKTEAAGGCGAPAAGSPLLLLLLLLVGAAKLAREDARQALTRARRGGADTEAEAAPGAEQRRRLRAGERGSGGVVGQRAI
jgi:hypothetical protein